MFGMCRPSRLWRIFSLVYLESDLEFEVYSELCVFDRCGLSAFFDVQCVEDSAVSVVSAVFVCLLDCFDLALGLLECAHSLVKQVLGSHGVSLLLRLIKYNACGLRAQVVFVTCCLGNKCVRALDITPVGC